MLAVAGLGALMSAGPCFAVVAPDPDSGASVQQSARAVSLLAAAAETARTRSWGGIQHVVSTRAGEPRLTVLQIQHTAGSGSTLEVLSTADEAVAADGLDHNLLTLLARHYDLRVAADTLCGGRPAHVVEAFRPGEKGADAVAGRFWIDGATGLLLRRDVLDESGLVARSSSFVSLSVGAVPVVPATYSSKEIIRPSGELLDNAGLQQLEDDGWPVASQLPSGLELFEARLHDSDAANVLQLSYSDGLSTLSLFVQKGQLPPGEVGTPHPMAGQTVWVSTGAAEQVVWAGAGRTWTLVSDAPDSMIVQAVTVLPHTPGPPASDGLLSRTWRGMSRVGSWLTPFG